MSKAPIAFFAYKRPLHTEQTLEALSRCEGAKDSELFIFCDGAKGPKDAAGVTEVRKIIRSRKWCGGVHIIEKDENQGLENSIIQGVTELCDKYGRVIVIEDDLITSKYFLDYMNTALDLFKKNERVMQISGYMFPIKIKTETDSAFLPFTTSWGWATWKRAWNHFDKDMKGYIRLKDDAVLRHRFNLEGSYPYFKIFKANRKGSPVPWDIRWYLSVFMLHGLTLFPSQTLIQNIGFDGSGTHCTTAGRDVYSSGMQENFRVVTFPQKIEMSEIVFAECKKILKKQRGHLFNRIKGTLSAIVEKYI